MNKMLMLYVAVGLCFAAHAADYTWTGNANDGGLWTAPGNWKMTGDSAAAADYPRTSSDIARFTSSATVLVDSGDTLAVGLLVVNSGASLVTLNGTAGSVLNVSGAVSVNSSSFLVQSGCKLVVNLPVSTAVRIDKWHDGEVEFTADVTTTAATNPLVLDNGKVTLSGTMTFSATDGDVSIGNYINGDTATLELKDSASLTAANVKTSINGTSNAAVGHIIQNGAGTSVNVTGGLALSTKAGHLKPSVYELNAGTLTVGGTLSVGSAEAARYVQTGGTSTVAAVTLANGSSVSLNGGMMTSQTEPKINSGCVFGIENATLALSGVTLSTWDWSAFEVGPGAEVALTGTSSLSIPRDCSTFDMGLNIGAGKTVTVASGARVSAPVGSTNAWKVTLNEGSVLKLNESTARIAVPLDLTVNGSGKIHMNSASGSFGYAHAGAVVAHRLVVDGEEQPKGRYSGSSLFLDAGSTITARASIIVPYVWTGAGQDDDWNTAANWKDGSVPPSGKPVDISRATSITLNDDITVSCLVAMPNNVGRKTIVTGSGSISLSGDSYAVGVFVPVGCELVLDVDFKRTSNNSMSLIGGGRLTLKKAAPSNSSTGSLSPLMLLDGQMVFSGVKSLATYPVGGSRVFINHNAATPYAFGEVVIEDGTELSGIERLSEGYAGYPCSVALRQTGGTVTCDNFWIQNMNSTTTERDRIRYLLEGGSLTVPRAIYIGSTDQIATGGNASQPGGSFEMSGGTLTCAGFVGGCNQNYVRLYGGDVYLNGNMTTNAIGSGKVGTFVYNPITYYLGGVTIHPTGPNLMLDKGNAELTGRNGDTVFDVTERDFDFASGNTVSGPGGLVVVGGTGRTLMSHTPFTFTGAITVKSGNIICYYYAPLNGPSALIVENAASVATFGRSTAKALEKVVLAASSCLSVSAGETFVTKRLVVGGEEIAAGTYTGVYGAGSVKVTGSAPASWLDGTVGDLSWEADGTTTTVDEAVTLSSLTYDPVTAGETNMLTGAALTFEDGAVIHVEKGDTLVIDNNVVLGGKVTKTGCGEVVFNGAFSGVASPDESSDATDPRWLTVTEGGATFDGAVQGVRLMTCGSVDANDIPVITLKENCTVSNYGIVLTAWSVTSGVACRGETHQQGATVDYFSGIYTNLIAGNSNWALTNPLSGGHGRYVLDSGVLRSHSGKHLSFVWDSSSIGSFEFVQNGGTFILPKDFMFARRYDGVHFTYTLNGGRFEFGGYLAGVLDPSRNVMNLNGGTYVANASDSIKRESFALTMGGTVTFEVASGKSLTFADDATGPVSIVKTGDGALSLDGVIGLGGLDVRGGTMTLTDKTLPGLDGTADLSIAKTATLNLDYDGQMPFKTLKVGNLSRAAGLYSATQGSNVVRKRLAGDGALLILEGYDPGTVISFR